MKKANILQFIKFVFVGISNTLISEIVYVVLIYFNVHYLLASFIGFFVSVLNAFYWSNKYVFKEDPDKKRVWWKVLIKTYIAYIWGYLVSFVLLILWVDVVKLPSYMGPISEYTLKISSGFDADFIGQTLAEGINLIITVPMNYFINKKWAYK